MAKAKQIKLRKLQSSKTVKIFYHRIKQRYVLSMLRPSNMKPQTLRPIPPNEQNTMSYTNNEQYGGYSIAENDDDDEYTIS